ncbi:THUMP domain-containing protein 2 isoform X2 [Falco cherrug]|uniref:THUMP domain-containing protein 2 isoform X2 n=1 Tax=Falco cherrug TaxID=345164 RepID=UPI00247AD565|nr:THUMP domain-containing protein 2 isoform X2 [Falco cherrug]
MEKPLVGGDRGSLTEQQQRRLACAEAKEQQTRLPRPSWRRPAPPRGAAAAAPGHLSAEGPAAAARAGFSEQPPCGAGCPFAGCGSALPAGSAPRGSRPPPPPQPAGSGSRGQPRRGGSAVGGGGAAVTEPGPGTPVPRRSAPHPGCAGAAVRSVRAAAAPGTPPLPHAPGCPERGPADRPRLRWQSPPPGGPDRAPRPPPPGARAARGAGTRTRAAPHARCLRAGPASPGRHRPPRPAAPRLPPGPGRYRRGPRRCSPRGGRTGALGGAALGAKMAARGRRYFCTAGRGLEPFLAREVRARLGATEVQRVPGKVSFRAGAAPGRLRGLRCAERLFLLLRWAAPLRLRSKGKMLHEIKSLVIEEPTYWLDVISVWRNFHGHEGKNDDTSQENQLPLKRKSEEETNTAAKRQKAERVRETVSEECQVEAGERCVGGQGCCTESMDSSEDPSKCSGEEEPVVNEQPSFSFRVSCRCSGAIAKVLTSQEIGRAIGTALMKQCGWRADLRDPDLEIFVHLNDIHSVVGIPLFRLPLANREYIKTAGLRSTIAWAMASLAEISAGAFVLDPMCGLGTILVEAAKEWPEACYWGADISDSQLEGADVNIRTAGLMDKIELFKASVKGCFVLEGPLCCC